MSYQPAIYTAGKMDWEEGWEEDSSWRESIELEIDGAEWIHPTETFFDHGGDTVGGCVAEDMGMIEQADGVIAVISHDIQVGTVTEIVHAVNSGEPVLAIFTTEVVDPTQIEPVSGVGEEPEIRRATGPVFTRVGSPHYWFLINYLVGDGIGSRPRNAPVEEWDGFDNSTVYTAPINQSQEIIRNWYAEEFQ